MTSYGLCQRVMKKMLLLLTGMAPILYCLQLKIVQINNNDNTRHELSHFTVGGGAVIVVDKGTVQKIIYL